MRKKLFVSLFCLGGLLSAQNITDALRYSTDELSGTARFKSMSGAFGALGGDLSALGINPAGSAVFSSSEFVLSFGNEASKFQNTYNRTIKNNKDADFLLNQTGIVFSIPDGRTNAKWKKIVLGFNYNGVKNFNNKDISFAGNSVKNLGDYFTHFANGIPQSQIIVDESKNETISSVYKYLAGNHGFNSQQAFLGYQGYLVNPNSKDPDETGYTSNAVAKTTLQNFEISSEGGISQYDFNFAAQYGDDIYLGINLNSYNVDFFRKIYHTEDYSDGNVKFADFQNSLKTTGSGFSLQLGAIAKITNELRVGASYKSPTWYTLNDETTQYLKTAYYEGDKAIPRFVVPDAVNVYEEYKLRTPGSWTASVAYIFGKSGLLSFDYIYKGYGGMQFKTDFLKPENQVIQNELGDVNIIRFGGEYRIKALSLRAGMRYEQSPYKGVNKPVGDLKGYSLGVGYSFGGIRFDVSYDIAKQDFQYQPYESVLRTPAYVSTDQRNLLFTLSTKLF